MKDVIFSSMFLLCITLQFTSHMISNHLYVYKYVKVTQVFISNQKRGKNVYICKHLNFTYLSNYPNNTKQKIKQFKDVVYIYIYGCESIINNMIFEIII